MRRIHLNLICFVLLACTTITAWAVVPPPPVNQNLGIPDTQFKLEFNSEEPGKGYMTCQRCHKWNRGMAPQPDGIPALQIRNLADRHHENVGTPIAGGPEQPPNADGNGDGVVDAADADYTCYNCHNVTMPVGPDGGIEENHRNCFNCHKVFAGPNNTGEEMGQGWRTVHHDTPKAFNAECGLCHGYLIRSLDTGRPAPDWQPSYITPWKSGKPLEDPTMTSNAGTHPGNCTFCHNTADVDGDPAGTEDNTSSFSWGTDGTDGFGPIRIYRNSMNHHSTGVPTITPAESPKITESACQWCHYMSWPDGFVPFPGETLESWNIRGCQRCHDITSLHSIEADVAGDGIVPGAEAPYNGHVGAKENCWGCHGHDQEALRAEGLAMNDYPVQATTPQLTEIGAPNWAQGSSFDLTLLGSGFENAGVKWEGGTWVDEYYTPSVQLTDDAGNATVLVPEVGGYDKTRIVVTIPGTLAAGQYAAQIKKGNVLSNPIPVTIFPAVNVRPGGAVCLSDYRVVIIRGSGFSMYDRSMPSSVTGITGDGADANRVFLWRDGMVAARFNAGCPSEVTVNTVFDSETFTPAVR